MITFKQLCGLEQSHLIHLPLGAKHYLVNREVDSDLKRLHQAALSQGFDFHIASGYRDFERQLTIWNRKMSGQSPVLDKDSKPLDSQQLTEQERIFAILRWSALPGTSRHHWGTDFDLYVPSALPDSEQLKLEPWEYLTGHQSAFYQWLSQEIKAFGFFFPYRHDLGGVSPEPWHISHQRTASQCLEQLSIDQVIQLIHDTKMLGKDSVLRSIKSIYTQFIKNISD